MSHLRPLVTTVRQHSPTRLLRAANRAYHRQTTPGYHPGGVDLFAEDWDVCLLLDACRADMLDGHRDLLPADASVSETRSRGSSTRQFLSANVAGRQLDDTVYVTANPQFAKHSDRLDGRFHAVEHVWRDEWDEDAKTVRPATVTDELLAARDRYPNKRILAHYLQPHYPFLGSDAAFDKRGHIHADGSFWTDVREGRLDVDADRIWELYHDNLAHALEAIQPAFDRLQGRLVVTSDHGNMVGERARPIPVREWGHPPDLFTDELLRVPWVVIEGAERPAIEAEPPAAHADTSAQTVGDRLTALGYTQ